MKRIVLALAVVVAALGLVACGGGGGSTGSGSTVSDSGGSVDQAEVAEGVALYRQYQRLEAMAHKGDLRTGQAEEYGTPAEVESSEEATAEIRDEAEQVFSELNEESAAVQRAVLAQIHAEK